jgi:hypothetical protein
LIENQARLGYDTGMDMKTCLVPMLLLALVTLPACEPARDARLDALVAKNPVLSLLASSGVVAGTDSVCVDVFPADWVTYNARDLADRTNPEKLAAGHEWLQRAVMELSRDERESALARIQGRVDVYVELDSWRYTVESQATGVALTPALVDLLPSNIESRASDPMSIGWTLASAEHAQLEHRVAQRLGDMPPHERAAVLRGFEESVIWAEAQQQAGDDEH